MFRLSDLYFPRSAPLTWLFVVFRPPARSSRLSPGV